MVSALQEMKQGFLHQDAFGRQQDNGQFYYDAGFVGLNRLSAIPLKE